MKKLPKIYPVILSGGLGKRLWPISRETYPKQLIPLISEHSLFQKTTQRIKDPLRYFPATIVCNAEQRFVIAEQLNELNVSPNTIILEPTSRNTAPATALACILLSENSPNSLILVLPSDHVISGLNAFEQAIEEAASAALDGYIVTFGIEPNRIETGYGYIKSGKPLSAHEGVFKVSKFVEKPDVLAAKKFLSTGTYSWNSGMFIFKAHVFLDELKRLEPEIVNSCRKAIQAAKVDLDFVRVDETIFKTCPLNSIDKAVMEHTKKAVVKTVQFGWNDVGAWQSLWDLSKKDGENNVIVGNVEAFETQNSYIRSEGPLVATLGVEDLIVVVSNDAILVTKKDRSQEVGEIAEKIKIRGHKEATLHPKVHRPWGYYQILHAGEKFQVKLIEIKTGARISLQTHNKRAEHWVVVAGKANIQKGKTQFILNENESTYISANTIHRLSNQEQVPLKIIEVQTGSYLGEDDIIRYADDFGR